MELFTGLRVWLGKDLGFVIEKPLFPGDSTSVTGQFFVEAYDAVAGNEDGKRIAAYSGTCGTDCTGAANLGGQCAVGQGGPEGDFFHALPDTLLEWGAGEKGGGWGGGGFSIEVGIEPMAAGDEWVLPVRCPFSEFRWRMFLPLVVDAAKFFTVRDEGDFPDGRVEVGEVVRWMHCWQIKKRAVFAKNLSFPKT